MLPWLPFRLSPRPGGAVILLLSLPPPHPPIPNSAHQQRSHYEHQHAQVVSVLQGVGGQVHWQAILFMERSNTLY